MASMRKAMALSGPIVQHVKAVREALEDVDGSAGLLRRFRLWWWREDVLGVAIDALKALEQRQKDGSEIKTHLQALVKIMGGRVDFKGKKKEEEKEE